MNRIIFFLSVALLAACSVSHVDHYPGKSIPLFPADLQGEYRFSPGGFKAFFQGKQLDSARVKILADRTETLNEDGWVSDFIIDKDNVLSQIDNYYFLSRKDVAEPDYWNSTLLWGNEKEIYLVPINETDKNLKNDKLKNYLTLNVLIRKNNKETIQKVLPTDKAMLKALSTITTDSKDTVLFYHMDDALLMKYIQKEVSTRNALRFVRIKQETPVK